MSGTPHHRGGNLVQAIWVFVGAGNERCQAFSWTTTPKQILATARRS